MKYRFYFNSVNDAERVFDTLSIWYSVNSFVSVRRADEDEMSVDVVIGYHNEVATMMELQSIERKLNDRMKHGVIKDWGYGEILECGVTLDEDEDEEEIILPNPPDNDFEEPEDLEEIEEEDRKYPFHGIPHFGECKPRWFSIEITPKFKNRFENMLRDMDVYGEAVFNRVSNTYTFEVYTDRNTLDDLQEWVSSNF